MRGRSLFIVLLLVMAFSFVSAASQQNQSKIDDGFTCLEDKVGDCSSLTTQELALTLLASPDNVFNDCLDELKSRESGDNWGNIRDTALAVLALEHAGENTQASEEWLLEQTRTPTELDWYLEQDSNSATTCSFGYDANTYNVDIGDNKKLESDAGSCLTRAQSNFWLRIDPSCYDNEFSVSCTENFIATLLYKNGASSTIHVLEGTESSPAFGTIKLSVKSKCFGSGSCDYEATAWSTVALLRTGHDVSDFIPYVVAMAETNDQYLPNAFTYMATSYNDYATRLIEDVKLGNYWLATNSAYDKFYDTALALVALGSSSSDQVTNSRDWLLFSQGNNGCWQNSIRDTAIVLWALEGRAASGGGGGGSTTYCSEAGYFCIPSADCPPAEDVGGNYFCSSLSETCCINENLKTCAEFGGDVCSADEVCTGNERRSADQNQCCTGECVPKPVETECESMTYNCLDQCSDYQEEVSTYACDGQKICCRTKTTTAGGGSLWWLWVLIILIVLTVLAIIFRKALQNAWFKMRSKFKKDTGKKGPPGRPGPGPGRPGIPPAGPGGLAPLGRPPMMRRPAPPVQRRTYDRRDKEMSATFRKLRELSR